MATVASAGRVRREDQVAHWWRRFLLLALSVVLLAFTLMVIVPFIWMLVMSFRTTGEILAEPYGLPTRLSLENYHRLFFDPAIRFSRYFVNSAFVSGVALVLTSVLSTMAGYGFGRTRYHFRLRSPLFGILLLALMLPPQILYLPQFTMMGRYGLLGSRWSLVLLYTATALPVSIYLMATYFSQLPGELEDAARIDGCTEFRTFWQVMLPLSRPALATVVLLNFLHFWNELLLAVTMVTDPALRTLPAAMMMFVGEHGSNYAIAAASLVSAMLPVLILYLVLSDKFIEGLTAGALKGA